MQKKINVAVLCGGISPEREVSLKSGARVAEALRQLGYNAIEVDPSIEYKAPHSLSDIHKKTTPLQPLRRSKNSVFTASALRICEKSDAVFMALHGGAGENGMIAAALECRGIKHTGSDFRGMCIAMDKLISKRLFEAVSLYTPEHLVISSTSKVDGADAVNPPFPPPYVIKPINGGSSIGIRIAETAKELSQMLNKTPSDERDGVLIERRIIGREFTVGILNGEPLAVTEIVPRSGFYDYENKYTPGRTEEITPANIPKGIEKRLKDTAILAHNALFLGSYSRVDMILEDRTGQIFVLEANTLPGMTETSLLPQGAQAIGIDFPRLCERMLLSAIQGA